MGWPKRGSASVSELLNHRGLIQIPDLEHIFFFALFLAGCDVVDNHCQELCDFWLLALLIALNCLGDFISGNVPAFDSTGDQIFSQPTLTRTFAGGFVLPA